MSKATTIDEYIAQQGEWQAATMKKLVRLVKKQAPESVGDIKWSQPVFSASGPMAYMKSEKGYVRFGFWRGAELDDPGELLEGGGTKMRHVKIAQGEAIPKALAGMIAQARELNEKHGDPTSRAALAHKPAKKKAAKKKKRTTKASTPAKIAAKKKAPAKKKKATKKRPAKKKKAPAKKKKAPAKKKKAPAKKRPAKKKKAPAKKRPAKKKKAPAKKRPAKKKKAPAKKRPAKKKKAPAKKKRAPAKRRTAAKKK